MNEGYSLEAMKIAFLCADRSEDALIAAEDAHRAALAMLRVVFGTEDLNEARSLYIKNETDTLNT